MSKTSPDLSLEGVLNALRSISGPDFKMSEIDLRENGSVSLSVTLSEGKSAMKEKIERDIRAALAGVKGMGLVELRMKHSPESGSVSSGAAGMLAGIRQIIAVSSGKGGVGKSTVAVNVATALAMDGARVGLLDADVYGPNVPTMMGVTEGPRIIPHPEDPKLGEVFLPPQSHGVKIMSMGFLMRDDQPAIWRGPMLHSVVGQFFHKVIWGDLDYLVIDMPPGTGDIQLSVAQLAPLTGAVLVTTPQEVSAQDVRKAYHMFEKVRVPVLGFVENMSWFKCDGCEKKHTLFGKEGGRKLAQKFGVELLAQLPMNPQVREGGDEGTPIVIRAAGSEVAKAFRELARKIVSEAAILSGKTAGTSGTVEIGRFD